MAEDPSIVYFLSCPIEIVAKQGMYILQHAEPPNFLQPLLPPSLPCLSSFPLLPVDVLSSDWPNAVPHAALWWIHSLPPKVDWNEQRVR